MDLCLIEVDHEQQATTLQTKRHMLLSHERTGHFCQVDYLHYEKMVLKLQIPLGTP